MAFLTITKASLDTLNQQYRVPGILPGAMKGGRGTDANPENVNIRVPDEIIRIVPFVRAGADGRPFAKQFVVRVSGDLFEPEFTRRSADVNWVAGTTTAAGMELTSVSARFKKISTVVRTDELMNDGALDDDMLRVQIRLAAVGTVRAISEAFFFSKPLAADDATADLEGLPGFLATSQDVTWDPTKAMIGGLSELEVRCCPSDGDFGAGPDVFVVSSRARWRLLKELEDKGVTPDFHTCALTGRRRLHFHGIPVLTGRVPEFGTSPSDFTQAWALKLKGPTGVRILHVGGDSSTYGLRVEPITTMIETSAGEASKATRGVEVFGNYSVVVPEAFSIARLKDIPVKGPFTAGP